MTMCSILISQSRVIRSTQLDINLHALAGQAIRLPPGENDIAKLSVVRSGQIVGERA
jgi:hypothetical protein